jgi:hypothetical protein
MTEQDFQAKLIKTYEAQGWYGLANASISHDIIH